jgi:hypothetical protein
MGDMSSTDIRQQLLATSRGSLASASDADPILDILGAYILDAPTTDATMLQGTILYNERLLHSVPVLIATVISAQQELLPISQRVDVEVVAHALPAPVPYALGHAVAVAFFSLMVAYMPSVYVSAVVIERKQLLKGLLEVRPIPARKRFAWRPMFLLGAAGWPAEAYLLGDGLRH